MKNTDTENMFCICQYCFNIHIFISLNDIKSNVSCNAIGHFLMKKNHDETQRVGILSDLNFVCSSTTYQYNGGKYGMYAKRNDTR